MKYILLFLILFSSQLVFAQNIVGEYWGINVVIGEDTENIQEFVLDKIDKKFYTTDLKDKHDYPYPPYGLNIIFNEDNSFKSAYSAFCGMDCFPSSFGTYKFADAKHINLYVKEFSQEGGTCKTIKKELNLKLGNYYIAESSDKIIKLIKSNGNKKQDKKNEEYSSMIDKHIKLMYEYTDEKYRGQYRYQAVSQLLDYKPIVNTNPERVREYLRNKLKITNYKILYTTELDRTYLINLVQAGKEKNNYLYILNNFTNDYENKVGQFKEKK